MRTTVFRCRNVTMYTVSQGGNLFSLLTHRVFPFLGICFVSLSNWQIPIHPSGFHKTTPKHHGKDE